LIKIPQKTSGSQSKGLALFSTLCPIVLPSSIT